MEESKAQENRWDWRGDLGWLALLVLLAVALHAWMIRHTAVVARDSIGYIHYALLFEQMPFTQALRKMEQHPLYPAYLLAVSVPVRHIMGTTAGALSLSCQIASSLAAVLLVFPMFYLGRALFNARVGFWAAAIFQCLPICVQVTSDGLSDALFLLLTTTALALAVVALQARSRTAFFLAGLATGLAYLTRPEGALVAVAALLVLAALQWLPSQRWTWQQGLGGAAGLLVGATLIATPYMLVVGGITNKPTARMLLEPAAEQDNAPKPAWQTSAGSVPLAATLAVWWIDERREGAPPLLWVAKTLLQETMHAFHYLGWLPALLGLWWYRGRLRHDPGLWLLLTLGVLLSLVLFRVLMVAQYLSERHTLLIVLGACVWAAAALVRIADALAGFAGRWLAPRWQPVVGVVFLAAISSWCLPAALKPLHANRAGHRAAGEWLAVHADDAAEILDPFCWARFYSGQALQPAGPRRAPRKYIVLTESKNAHARLGNVPQARELAQEGTVVFRWEPSPRELKRYKAEPVVVYAVP